MKKLIGGVVLVAGVVVAGWYGTANNAKTMQAKITSDAENATQGTIHSVTTSVSGRDILVSGIAASAQERDQILTALNEVDGRRLVRDELLVLEVASPFEFDAEKSADGSTYSGMISTEAERTTMSDLIGPSADDLNLVSGAPDGNWTGVLSQGLDGLAVLEAGSLSVRDSEITLIGSALSPDEDAAARAALADLPEGYNASFDITTLDDGTPFRLMVDRAEDGAVTSTGKVPSTLDIAELSAALGADVGMGINQSVLPPNLDGWANVSTLGVSALSELRSGEMQMTEDMLTVSGVATPDGKAAAEAMIADLPSGFSATSDITIYDDGAPFSLEMISNSGVTIASGKFPANVRSTDVVGDVLSNDVRNAFIGDDTSGFEASATGGAMALAQLEEGTLSVTGTDVMLTGVARTPTEAEAAMAMLGDLPDGYNASFDITTLDDGAPFSLEMKRTGDMTTASGKFPADLAAADVVGNVPSSNIRNAFIGDDSSGFEASATGGAMALAQLEEGTLSVIGTDVILTGVARTPTEAEAAMAMLDDLPDGYNADIDISTLDDGTPPNFDVIYTAGEVATVEGKLPAGLQINDIASALDLPSINGTPVLGFVGDSDRTTEQLAAISDWLPQLDSLKFSSNGDAVTVEALASSGVDQDVVQAGIAQSLGETATVSVAAPIELPDTFLEAVVGELAEPALQAPEPEIEVVAPVEEVVAPVVEAPVVEAPIVEMAFNADSCNAQSAAALQTDRINFVIGSSQLDAQSERAINAVAEIMLKCLAETDLNVEIGGHTDSQGGAALNLRLSTARAESVRDALIASGVPAEFIIAKGFGEAEPIASNANAEGRAANRRTTITWFEPSN